MNHILETTFAGRNLKVEYGKIGMLSNAAILMSYGDTVILVNANASEKPREGVDFFPLSIEYEERLYSVGKIPGGFIKREGRPSEKAILHARAIDRPLRPLFPKGYRNDVQVVCTVISVENDNLPEILAMNAASMALCLSSIPFTTPVGTVDVGLIDGKFIANPNSKEREASTLRLTVCATKERVMMIEAGADEIPEDVMIDAIKFGFDECQKIVAFQEEAMAKFGKEKIQPEIHTIDEALEKEIRDFAFEDIKAAMYITDKDERNAAIDKVKEKISEAFNEKYPDDSADIADIVYRSQKETVRNMILNEDRRPDGRGFHQIRPISCETSLLPRTHGTGLFTRGLTQVLTVATLGSLGDIQILDGISEEESKRYMHHYNFPSYSVGEVRPLRGPGRREIGHGALAERALEPLIPSEEEFPYTIRLVSEVLSSNGSTSQASVCGSTLSLLDAGVPIKDMVAGIAMGLIKHDGKVAVLSDIQGMEDHLGDMDFKVAGTEYGITAIQMDIKIDGIDKEILQRALKQAKEGRIHILGEMRKTISQPKPELSPYAPKIVKMQINPDKIKDVIGPGGKIITKIIDETGVKIDIEQTGEVFISGIEIDMIKKAQELINNIVVEPEVGKTYKGKVSRIMNFGAFVEILPGKEGLLHISHIAHERVAKVEDVLNIGDEVEVKVTEIDEKGRVNLSRKVLLPKPEHKNK